MKKTNDKVIVWIKYLESDKSYKLVLTEIDCKKFQIRKNQTISYDNKGNVVNSSSITSIWEEIIPESNGEGYFDVFCKNEPDFQSILTEVDNYLENKEKIIYVSSKNANLRNLPSVDGVVIKVLSQGTKLIIKKEEGSWYLVSTGDHTAWIHNSTVSSELANKIQSTKEKPFTNTGEKKCKEGDKVYIKTEKAPFLQSPNGGVYMNLQQGYSLTLLSDKQYNGYYWLSDKKYKLNGYVLGEFLDCHSAEINPKVPQTTTKSTTDNDSFVAVYTGRDENPSIEVINNTNRQITLVFGSVIYKIPSQKSKQLNVNGGNYEFTVSANGVRPLSGVKKFEKGYGYTWTFTIVTNKY